MMGGVSIGLIVFLSAFYFLIFLQLVLLAWLNIYTSNVQQPVYQLSFQLEDQRKNRKAFGEKNSVEKKVADLEIMGYKVYFTRDSPFFHPCTLWESLWHPLGDSLALGTLMS